MFEWGVENLSFSGGETMQVEKGSMFIIIGPNNSGKSRALREIVDSIRNRTQDRKVVKDLKIFSSEGDNESSILQWLSERFSFKMRNGEKIYITKGSEIHERNARNILGNLNTLVPMNTNQLSSFFFELLDTVSRLQLVNPASFFNPLYTGPQQYIHVLQSNEELLKVVNLEFRKAFGSNLVINWFGEANNVYFHIGDEPERTIEKDRISIDYQSELAKLPKLHEEGDGVRSFVGTLLAAKVGGHPLLLIDEPEAFLHPKQAERLGGILASSAEQLNRQVIVATHSSSFIRGAINTSSKVSICRLTRNISGSVNHASALSSDDLKNLWSSPLLRSTAAIEGVFSNGVVVCEADTDCRFYEVVLNKLEAEGKVSSPAELHFVHGSGKGKLPVLANAYKRLNVAVAVIADLDLMRDVNQFKPVIESLGGNFNSISDVFNRTLQSLNDIEPRLSLSQFIQEARLILDNTERGNILEKRDRIRLLEMLEHTAKWSEAKRYGIAKLRGQARRDCDDLLDKCRKMGLFLVPNGELESWWPYGPTDKKNWLAPAIEQVFENNPELKEAEKFVTSVYNYISQHITGS